MAKQLPHLDALRTISFLMVFFHHAAIYLTNSSTSSFLKSLLIYPLKIGNLGVNFFFVLSGFLITYLLYREKIKFKTINIKIYLLKRILRIWPLYFLTMFIGLIIIPYISSRFNWAITKEHLPSFLLFFYNFDRITTGFTGIGSDLLGVLWSISVEEQFYLFWPFFIWFFSINNCFIIGMMMWLGSIVFRYLNCGHHDILYFSTFSVISDIALGSIAAYLFIKDHLVIKYIKALKKNKILGIYILGIVTIIYLRTFPLPPFLIIIERSAIGLFFSFMLLEQLCAHNSVFKLGRSQLLTLGGKYTYALYCLHLVAISITVKACSLIKKYLDVNIHYIFCFAIALFLSFILSYLSYEYFEKFFLSLKDRFSVRTY